VFPCLNFKSIDLLHMNSTVYKMDFLCCEFFKCFFVSQLRSSVMFVSLLHIRSIAYLRCIVSCCEFNVTCFLVGQLKSSVRSIGLLHIR